MDDVDPLATTWSAEEVEVMHGLRDWVVTSEELNRHLGAWMRLPASDANALGQIVWAEEGEEPLSPSVLARRIGMTSGATTALIDRLEAAGHVRRHREGADRRRVTLRATEGARRESRRFLAFSGKEIATALRGTDPAEARTVVAFLARMTTAAAAANERLRGETAAGAHDRPAAGASPTAKPEDTPQSPLVGSEEPSTDAPGAPMPTTPPPAAPRPTDTATAAPSTGVVAPSPGATAPSLAVSERSPRAATPSPRPPGRTLVVGCGRVGTRLGELLVQAGGDVVGLRRTPSEEPGAFPVLPADLRNPLPEELPRADALVIALTPSGLAEPEAEDGYRAALEHLAAALPHPPERAIFVSSTRVFEGWTDVRAVTEADEPAPASPRARSLLRGEALAAELFGAQVVRPAGIYGPGRDMLLRKVLDAAPVDHARRTNRIHEADLAALLQAMLGDPAAPRLVHAVDRAPGRPLGEVVAYLADRLSLPTPPHADPEPGGGSEYDGARALALLGALRYPTFREGYAEIVDGR